MNRIFSLIGLLACLSACGQSPTPKLIGGRCEGCEAVLEFGDRKLSAVDTLLGFPNEGEPLKVSGIIYQPDGKTPASGAIMYVYHTDAKGIYPSTGNETNWARRHGNMRGWIKTGRDGKYSFYTIRPASYPNTTVVQHIHATILEPDGSYYYIQDFLFQDDPNLKPSDQPTNPRGGKGYILNLTKVGQTWTGKRNIILRKGL